MKAKSRAGAAFAAIIILFTGCTSPVMFGTLPFFAFDAGTFFPFVPSKDHFEQKVFNKNDTTATFKVFDDKNHTIANLKPADIDFKENGTPITNFQLGASTSTGADQVDIVFALDITGSMQDVIDTVKSRVENFVTGLAARGVKANLCLVLFKDDVERECTKWVEDDPATPQNENLVAFLDDVSKITAGGGDKPKENSLGGLLSAAAVTPWHVNAQRMVLLVTDYGYWVKPIDMDEPEAATAPYYDEVLKAVVDGHVMTFCLTIDWGGFSHNYFQYPSFPNATGGKFFDLYKLQSGGVTIDQIYDSIQEQITWKYKLSYTVEDNPGLDPTLPLSQRSLTILPKPSVNASSVKTLTFDSTMPAGHPQYLNRWELNHHATVNLSTLKVLVNGNPVSQGYHLDNGDLVFDQTPAPGTKIDVTYELGTLRDNVRETPIILKNFKVIQQVKVKLNDQEASEQDYSISRAANQTPMLNLAPHVFDDTDPFGIRARGGLDIFINYQFR